MQFDGLEDILEEFPPHFDCVKPLCRELRGILFPYHILNTRVVGLFVGTPKDPEILYGPIINAFGKAIDTAPPAPPRITSPGRNVNVLQKYR
ncbi:hypothetical protein GQ44DRAFT_702345 [Phaeosphaeriaceae sp. PMI808]|nr:hypothetical protein GQ44DRAFT_702345 [Phaeosphaeriaceae sp. PMI808]